jgi:hypothetical protein
MPNCIFNALNKILNILTNKLPNQLPPYYDVDHKIEVVLGSTPPPIKAPYIFK